MKKIFTLFSLALLTMSAMAQTTVTTTYQANALEDNSGFTFNGNAVVTVQMNDYLFVRDDSGYGLIYGAEGTFENGQVLNQGWNATKASLEGWTRYTDAAGLSASGEINAALAAPQEVTTIDESMLNAYVCYKNVVVQLLRRNIKLPDGTTIPMYNMFNLNMPANGFPGMSDSHHNAYGIIGMQSGALKFIPVALEEYVEPTSLRGDVNRDGAISIADVTALIDYMLGNEVANFDAVAANCDLSEDGISIADTTALIDYLLNGSWD